MSRALDEAAVERAASGAVLRLPRLPHRGRVGEVRAASTGSSMEIHDFRTYQPGDDLRQLDWNAVARTGELVLRVRQDEVSPRVEVVLDGSRSMAVSSQKEARAAEVAQLLCKVAGRQGLEPTLLVTSRAPRRAVGAACVEAARAAAFDAADDLGAALRRAPPMRPCGLRLVVSDFLFDAPLESFAELLARGASALCLVQVLDEEDVDPSGGVGARLVDSESGEALERVLAAGVLESYRRRLGEHQKLLRAAAVRVRATLVTATAQDGVEALTRSALSPLWEGGA
ncbi:MAG: DUF58 domain-containing protein [Myxococcaceae bacterium]